MIRFQGIPYILVADHPEYAATTLGRVAETRRELTVAMSPGATVSGRVVDDWTGEPVAGATVTLDGAATRGSRPGAPTNSSGRFEITRLAIGNYTLHVEDLGRLPLQRSAHLRTEHVSRGGIDLGELRLIAGGTISGEVVDALGEPVPDAEVVAELDGPGADIAARTDAVGHFVLSRVPMGTAHLAARHAVAGAVREPALVRVRRLEDTPGVHLRLAGRLPP